MYHLVPCVGCMHALLIFLFGAELGYGSGVHIDWLVSCIQWKMNWYIDQIFDLVLVEC